MLDLFSNAYFTLREKKAVMVTCLCKIRQIDIIYIKKGQYGENFYFNGTNCLAKSRPNKKKMYQGFTWFSKQAQNLVALSLSCHLRKSVFWIRICPISEVICWIRSRSGSALGRLRLHHTQTKILRKPSFIKKVWIESGCDCAKCCSDYWETTTLDMNNV